MGAAARQSQEAVSPCRLGHLTGLGDKWASQDGQPRSPTQLGQETPLTLWAVLVPDSGQTLTECPNRNVPSL